MYNAYTLDLSKKLSQNRGVGGHSVVGALSRRYGIKSKIRHSYEAHTYLRHIGFARWFQRIESLFGGNWANGPSVRDKCPCQFSHGRECSISMYGEWWGETCPYWHVCGSLYMSGTMLKQSQGPRRVPREHAECFLSIVDFTNAEQRYH